MMFSSVPHFIVRLLDYYINIFIHSVEFLFGFRFVNDYARLNCRQSSILGLALALTFGVSLLLPPTWFSRFFTFLYCSAGYCGNALWD